MTEFLYGKNPIQEALRARKRKIYNFFYSTSPGETILKEVLALCEKNGVKSQKVQKDWFQKKWPLVVTQGWALEVSEFPYLEYEELLSTLQNKKNCLVLALDQIQDPQNLGAILRSAECSGVAGILLPKVRSSPLSPMVAKASAGALEYLNIAQVVNLARCLSQLKESGFWVVGTSVAEDLSQDSPKWDVKVQDALTFQWPEKTVLILGSEGEGMRRLIKDSCDFLIHLPLVGKIQSLNVSVTAAVCLYEYLRNYRNCKK